MKRLRHPIRAIREPFGTAGVVIAIIALIAALGGTAIASGGLSGPEKKLIQKEAKKWGKKFAKTGPAGPQGAPGTNGTNGKDGANGANGTDGKSVTSTPFEGSEEMTLFGEEPCEGRGGVALEVEASNTKKYACNGKEGSPWTAGGTLPSGKTETGAWSYGKVFYPGATAPINAAATFAIPLSAGVPGHLILANNQELAVGGGGVEEVTPTQCGAAVGGTAAEPKAAPGNFCMYIAKQTGTVALGAAEGSILESNSNILKPGSSVVLGGNTGTTGAILRIQLKATVAEPSPTSEGWGTWAVTG